MKKIHIYADSFVTETSGGDDVYQYVVSTDLLGCSDDEIYEVSDEEYEILTGEQDYEWEGVCEKYFGRLY